MADQVVVSIQQGNVGREIRDEQRAGLDFRYARHDHRLYRGGSHRDRRANVGGEAPLSIQSRLDCNGLPLPSSLSCKEDLRVLIQERRLDREHPGSGPPRYRRARR